MLKTKYVLKQNTSCSQKVWELNGNSVPRLWFTISIAGLPLKAGCCFSTACGEHRYLRKCYGSEEIRYFDVFFNIKISLTCQLSDNIEQLSNVFVTVCTKIPQMEFS